MDGNPGDGIWRYRDAVGSLPREISIGEGATPMVSIEHGGQKIHLKLEFLSPTGSYKDRGAAYSLSLLASLGAESVTEDSSGNAGAAYAAFAAALGLRCTVFVPMGAPPQKLEAIRRYGAAIHEVRRGREAAHRLARSRADYAGHSWAAPFLTGVGTLADEIVEQCGGSAPGEIIFPVGQGGLLYAVYLGFRRLLAARKITSLPVLTGVQAQNCAPLYWAAQLAAGALPKIRPKVTAADAAAIERPVRWMRVLQAVAETGGQWLTVGEEEISAARDSLLEMGYDVEPTSALPWAIALRRTRTKEGLKPDTVIPLTGSGWKSRGAKSA
ncbi:MAG: pyridoxal-phosphate dependent enzyme [Planctomycetota bacterium]|nr:pyridoxal-phosphate dependent enzyme [Planctomycetota bacterium]